MRVCVCTWNIAGAYYEPDWQYYYGGSGAYGGKSGIGALDGDGLAGAVKPDRRQAVCGGGLKRRFYRYVFIVRESDVAVYLAGEIMWKSRKL